MDATFLAPLVLLSGLLAGALLGWFVGSRPVADWRQRFIARDGEARELDEKFRAAIRDLAGASARAERADGLTRELAQARDEREAIRAELATFKANAANFDEQKRLLIEARQELLTQFRAAGGEVLSQAQESFLKHAEERFGHAEKSSKEAVAALLEPVHRRLKTYEEHVTSLEKQRVDSFGQLHGLINAMRHGQEQVRAEASRLSNVLSNAPKARGRWGENALKNLLEQCGLAEHTDFELEHSIDTEDGRLRPDAIVRIPGGKVLVIDSKVSLVAYEEAFHAEDDAVRKTALEAHVRSMKSHVQQLAAKSYQSQFEEAPDFVIMFVPGEHYVAAALDIDSELWEFAFRNRVLLATPTNLVAIARTVAQVWRQDALAQEAREIGRLGAEIYDRIAISAEHLKRVGGGLQTAVANYNRFVGSFERNVQSTARKLRDKGIEIGKREIEDVPVVEALPRHGGSEGQPDDVMLPAAGSPPAPEPGDRRAVAAGTTDE